MKLWVGLWVEVFRVFDANSMLTAVPSAAFAQKTLTLQQNMAEQRKQHIVPGKQLKAKGPNYEFCEVAPIMGTSMANAVANFYNPTGWISLRFTSGN